MNFGTGSKSEPPKRGRKNGAARKMSKSVEKLFDTFWRFLRFFALREKCRKVSKNFWHFLTIFDRFCKVAPFPPAPLAIRWVNSVWRWQNATERALKFLPLFPRIAIPKQYRKWTTTAVAKYYGLGRRTFFFCTEGSFGLLILQKYTFSIDEYNLCASIPLPTIQSETWLVHEQVREPHVNPPVHMIGPS